MWLHGQDALYLNLLRLQKDYICSSFQLHPLKIVSLKMGGISMLREII